MSSREMENTRSSVSSVLAGRVADWLMCMALENADLETIVQGCCERLTASGLPLARVHLSFSVLHPLYRAMGFTWRLGETLESEGHRHVREGETDKFLDSPYFHMFNHGLDNLRCRLEGETAYDFPIFKDLREEGLTDYMAFVTAFDGNSGQGMIGSWATNRAGGFSDAEIGELIHIQNRLAVACKMAVQGALAGSMLTTYLGADAGSRVLNGQIRRGDGETTRAVIIVADVRDSTTMAEQLGRQGYIDALNDFFDTVAGAFAEIGAEVLSFLGDGFLAVVPCGRNRAASTQASEKVHKAALEAIRRMKDTNQERLEDGQPEVRFGIGLHVGNVMFGNVGMEDRLTFSVFGASVNEASRLESLTKKYKTPIIASDAFISYCQGEWRELGEEKLRGVDEAFNVFAPAGKVEQQDGKPQRKRQKDVVRSNAESVILLHRERPRKAG